MHNEARTFVQSVASQRPSGPVVEIGGRNINGTIRDLFNGDRYTSVDIAEGPGVDVVANGTTFMPMESPSCVVCCEVLEHTAQAEAICRHAYDLLVPGGVFIVTTAMAPRVAHSARDGGPLRDGEFYRNVSEADLRRWLKPFARLTIEQHKAAGDLYAIAYKGTA